MNHLLPHLQQTTHINQPLSQLSTNNTHQPSSISAQHKQHTSTIFYLIFSKQHTSTNFYLSQFQTTHINHLLSHLQQTTHINHLLSQPSTNNTHQPTSTSAHFKQHTSTIFYLITSKQHTSTIYYLISSKQHTSTIFYLISSKQHTSTIFYLISSKQHTSTIFYFSPSQTTHINHLLSQPSTNNTHQPYSISLSFPSDNLYSTPIPATQSANQASRHTVSYACSLLDEWLHLPPYGRRVPPIRPPIIQ